MKAVFLTAIIIIGAGAILLIGIGCSESSTNSNQRLMVLSTNQMEFTAWAGFHPDPAQRKILVTIDGKPSSSWTASRSSSWIRIGPGSTDTIFVTVLSESLAAGTYTDTITVESTEATNSPLLIEVRLSVLNRVVLSPGHLTFSAPSGGVSPSSQDLEVTDFEGDIVSYQATTSASWIGLSGASGTVPATITVSVNISGLPAGQYVDSVVVTSQELPETRAIVICQLNLSSWASLSIGVGAEGVNLEGLEFVDASYGWISGWLPSYAGEPRGLVYRTSDGGTTWTQVLNRRDTRFAGLAAIDAEHCWVVGDSADIEYTVDGGANWNMVTGLPVDSTIEFSDVFFSDLATGWAVGGLAAIIRTADSGHTWTLQHPPTGHDLSGIVFLDNQTGWVAGNHGTILHTGDGGDTWTAQSTGIITDLRSVSFANSARGWAVGSAGKIIRTTDGGANWIELESPTDALLLDVAFVSNTRGWVVGTGGAIFHTNDGGETWLEQPTETENGLTEVFFLNDNQGWVVGDFGTVLVTASGGF